MSVPLARLTRVARNLPTAPDINLLGAAPPNPCVVRCLIWFFYLHPMSMPKAWVASKLATIPTALDINLLGAVPPNPYFSMPLAVVAHHYSLLIPMPLIPEPCLTHPHSSPIPLNSIPSYTKHLLCHFQSFSLYEMGLLSY